MSESRIKAQFSRSEEYCCEPTASLRSSSRLGSSRATCCNVPKRQKSVWQPRDCWYLRILGKAQPNNLQFLTLICDLSASVSLSPSPNAVAAQPLSWPYSLLTFSAVYGSAS